MTKRKMHTLPLYEHEPLHEYLESHAGFRSKTDLMLAALHHFQKCHLARFRDVNDAQTGPAMQLADNYIEEIIEPLDPISFVNLTQHLAIACQTAHDNQHWDFLSVISKRMGVKLKGLHPQSVETREFLASRRPRAQLSR